MSWGARNRSKDAKTPSAGLAMSQKPELDCRPVQPQQGSRRKKNNPGGGQGPGKRRRLLFVALALGQQPTGTAIQVPQPWSLLTADVLSITDPTYAYLIAERDGAPLGGGTRSPRSSLAHQK
jgi:hypothetical protein